jgi:hypothetical protein
MILTRSQLWGRVGRGDARLAVFPIILGVAITTA